MTSLIDYLSRNRKQIKLKENIFYYNYREEQRFGKEAGVFCFDFFVKWKGKKGNWEEWVGIARLEDV